MTRALVPVRGLTGAVVSAVGRDFGPAISYASDFATATDAGRSTSSPMR